MNLRFLLGESQFQANWFSSQFAIPAKWCSVLLSFGLFPGARLAIYSIALSVPYLNGSFPAKRTLDLFVSKRIVFLWAYCSSSLRCGLLQIDSRNKRKALLVWVLFLYTFYSICWLPLTFRIYNYNWRGKSVLTQSSLRSWRFCMANAPMSGELPGINSFNQRRVWGCSNRNSQYHLFFFEIWLWLKVRCNHSPYRHTLACVTGVRKGIWERGFGRWPRRLVAHAHNSRAN